MSNPLKFPNLNFRTFLALAAVFFAVLAAYIWISLVTERNTLRIEVQEQGKQLALSLEDTIDVVRSHVFTARRTAEHALARAGARHGVDLIQSESGSLHVDPNAELKQDLYSRNLSAASSILPGTAAIHQWNPVFQWTYFYDSKARWFLIYPYMSQEELLRSTKTGDLSAAFKVFFDADSTRPLEFIGPRSNPGREMRWTRSYEDAGGKGRMVTLLAPVYLADEFVGAIGTDVTLKQLNTTLNSHAPFVGRSLVVNDRGTLLADSGGALQDGAELVKFADLFPKMGNIPPANDPSWQRLPLRDTPWTLWVYAPNRELYRIVIGDLMSSFIVAGLLFITMIAVVWAHQRRSVALTETVETLEETRTALVKADRLGSIGGLVASVSREIDTPLRQATHTLTDLKSGLAAFREQQQRGLRRTELDDFTAHISQASEQLGQQLGDATDLLHRFRQLAIDQSNEQARHFMLRDMADNVLAVLRPALKRHNCMTDNAIPADMEVLADASVLGLVLNYLLNDAINRSHTGQTLKLTAGWDTGRDGEVMELTLADFASTPPEMTKEPLVLATRLVRQGLGGELEVMAEADGNRLTLRIPVAHEA